MRRISLFVSVLVFGATFFVGHSAFAAGWIQIQTGTTLDLYSVDHSAGFDVITANGSSVLTSNDQGKTWSVVSVGFGSYYGVDTVSSETGIIVGTSGKIYKTIDSGATWTQKTSGTTNILRAIDMLNPTTGWAVGDGGKILKTSTGGETWTVQTSGTTQTLWDVTASSAAVAWAVGGGGKILKTTDGGGTWLSQSSGTTTTLRSVDAVTASTVIAAGTNGDLFKTTNGGASWSSIDIPGVTYIDSVDFDTTSDGLLSTGLSLYESSNGGTTWTQVSLLDPLPAGTSFSNVLYSGGPNNRRAVGYGGIFYRYDGTAPVIMPFPITVTAPAGDSTPDVSWMPATDAESNVSYEISIDGGAYTNTGSGTTTTLAALADGSHSVSVRATDEAANTAAVGSATFTIEASGPTVGLVTPAAATVNVPVTLQVIPSDASGVASCTLTVNGVLQGSMSNAGGVFSRSHTFTSSGSATASATCTDAAGNSATGPDTTITVSAGADVSAPTVGAVSPMTATAGTAVTFTASVSDNTAVSSCNLYIGGGNQGGMIVSGGSASVSYTFSSAGTYAVYVQCADAAGNTGTGLSTTVTVAAAATTSSPSTPAPSPSTPAPSPPTPSTSTPPTTVVGVGTLIKTACPSGAAVDHPCKAVYYYGTDYKRHAFPHEKVFFSWYADFSLVVTIPDSEMVKVMLGKNVTYRPGVKMVKFTTVPTVYAVTRYGVLRPIASEAVAISLYGSTWNKKIDDIADAFYSNYTFGASITAAAQYNVSAETQLVPTINDNLL